MWRLWSKALGEKASTCNKEANIVSGIRTLILLLYLVTNIVIVSGVVRHWNDNSDLYYVIEIRDK
jgi:hypothetical protein